MKKIGIFPGSFDPFTKGHEAVIHKAKALFDEIIIGIGVNSTKNSMFTLEKRTNHIKSLFSESDNVRVTDFSGLTVDFCKQQEAKFIIRGLRDTKDFEYEKSIAHMNFEMAGIETVFYMTDQKYAPINSSIVREIHKNGGAIDHFVTNSNLLV